MDFMHVNFALIFFPYNVHLAFTIKKYGNPNVKRKNILFAMSKGNGLFIYINFLIECIKRTFNGGKKES